MIAFNGYGETNPNARLTKRKVRNIRANPRGMTNQQLAAKYGVSATHISDIRNGHVWTGREVHNHNAKLDPRKVRRIRKLVAGGMTRTAVANLFGVSQPTVSEIVLRKTWQHV